MGLLSEQGDFEVEMIQGGYKQKKKQNFTYIGCLKSFLSTDYASLVPTPSEKELVSLVMTLKTCTGTLMSLTLDT